MIAEVFQVYPGISHFNKEGSLFQLYIILQLYTREACYFLGKQPTF